jgi:hypothetical protein
MARLTLWVKCMVLELCCSKTTFATKECSTRDQGMAWDIHSISRETNTRESIGRESEKDKDYSRLMMEGSMRVAGTTTKCMVEEEKPSQMASVLLCTIRMGTNLRH